MVRYLRQYREGLIRRELQCRRFFLGCHRYLSIVLLHVMVSILFLFERLIGIRNGWKCEIERGEEYMPLIQIIGVVKLYYTLDLLP